MAGGIRVGSPDTQAGAAAAVDLVAVAGSAVGLAGAGAVGAGTQRVVLGGVDIIAAGINSLKHDLSSIAGTVTSVNTGVVGTGVQRVTIATDDAAVVALQLIDDVVGTIGAAFSGKVAVVGGVAESTVPTEVADGQAVAAWFDTFGRIVQLATDLATATLSVTDAAPAQMQVQGPVTLLNAVTGNGSSAALNVQDYSCDTFHINVTGVTNGADVLVEGTIDGGTTWYVIATHNIAANGVYETAISCQKYEQVRATVANRQDGTYTVKVYSGLT